MATTTAHDGTELYFEVHGSGPTLLAFANPRPPKGSIGIPSRKLCRALIENLTDRYRLVLMESLRRASAQYVTYYQGLQNFDDQAAQEALRVPRLCYVGTEDHVVLNGKRIASFAGTMIERLDELERYGWDVRTLDGLNHMKGMRADVSLSLVEPWLDEHLLA